MWHDAPRAPSRSVTAWWHSRIPSAQKHPLATRRSVSASHAQARNHCRVSCFVEEAEQLSAHVCISMATTAAVAADVRL